MEKFKKVLLFACAVFLFAVAAAIGVWGITMKITLDQNQFIEQVDRYNLGLNKGQEMLYTYINEQLTKGESVKIGDLELTKAKTK